MLRYCRSMRTVDLRRRETPAARRRPPARSRSASSASLAASKSRSKILQLHFGHAAVDFVRVQEAFAVVGRLGRQAIARQPGDEIGRRPDRVGHPPLGDRRMDVHAADGDHGQVGRKGLHVDLVAAVAVERVADRGADLGQVEVIDAAADLLVAGEADADRAVRRFPDAPSSQAAVSMMMATPALSSAPSSVVPSVVMSVWPTERSSSGLSATRITRPGSPGKARCRRRDSCAITCGLTSAPVVSGEVSEWAAQGDRRRRRRSHRGRDRRQHDAVLVLPGVAMPRPEARRPAAARNRVGPANSDSSSRPGGP